jgi:hypothetical protein
MVELDLEYDKQEKCH